MPTSLRHACAIATASLTHAARSSDTRGSIPRRERGSSVPRGAGERQHGRILRRSNHVLGPTYKCTCCTHARSVPYTHPPFRPSTPPAPAVRSMLRIGILVSLLSLAGASPMPRMMRVHARRDSAPAGFIRAADASPDTTIKLRLALAQSNPAGLEDALYAVSTPSSEQYGKYLTREEVSLGNPILPWRHISYLHSFTVFRLPHLWRRPRKRPPR